MAKKDEFNDPKKSNIKALTGFRLDGKHVGKGDVVSKKDFPNKSDWQNLCHMTPARAEETDDKVGAAKADDKKAPKTPPGAPG